MDKRFQHVIAALREQPWAMEASAFEALVEIVARRIDVGKLTSEEIAAAIGDRERGSGAAIPRVGSVAVLALHGPMSQRMNLFSAISGGTSTEIFGRDFDAAIADPEVAAIVISIDSPGGSVAGTAELADKIFKARGAGKPIVAVSDSQAASAAYWVGSQAHEFVASPSSLVGSIGVVTQHRDVSKAETEMGVKTTVIAIPAAKAEAHPYTPLSEEALAGIVATMQPFYDLFTKAVARGRGVAASAVKEGYGEGRQLAAVPAKAAGMVDRIESLSDVIARVSTPQGRRAVLQAQSPSLPETTTVQDPPLADTTQESRPRAPWRALFDTQLKSLESRT